MALLYVHQMIYKIIASSVQKTRNCYKLKFNFHVLYDRVITSVWNFKPLSQTQCSCVKKKNNNTDLLAFSYISRIIVIRMLFIVLCLIPSIKHCPSLPTGDRIVNKL